MQLELSILLQKGDWRKSSNGTKMEATNFKEVDKIRF